MGQAGAQREPSMEEILASIRRIIENNEPAQQDDDGQPGEAVDHDADADEALAQHADEADDDAHLAVATHEPASQPVSLAEVAARARTFPQMTGQDMSQDRATASGGDDHNVYSNGYDQDEAADDLREALVSDEPVEAPAVAEIARNDAEDEKPVAQTAERTDAELDHGSARMPEGAGQLLSLHTGEKVARAFGELDAALAAGQRRSFDEIAEEMLRPMLTQWLDDNLPTLVERLVREEIERVSRGNRR